MFGAPRIVVQSDYSEKEGDDVKSVELHTDVTSDC